MAITQTEIEDAIELFSGLDQTHDLFEQAGVTKFEFKNKDGRVLTMNYFALPDPCYDDPELCLLWAKRSLDVALRANSKKRKKKR